MVNGMKDKTLIEIVAMICIVVLVAIAVIVLKTDGMLLSGAVGAIVFIVTRKYYKPPASS